MVSVNRLAMEIISKILDNARRLRVDVLKIRGATVIDAGVRARGGLEAGRLVAEVCMGGLGKVSVTLGDLEGKIIPYVTVSTDNPPIACMASQYAGWSIRVGKYFAMGSGPARALSQKPKHLFDELNYADESSETVIVLESLELPSEEVVEYLCNSTGVSPEGLYMIVTPTRSISGSVQISARIVETGIHKMHTLGLPLNSFVSGIGRAPVAPGHPRFVEAMGRTNDAQLYMGEAYYYISYENFYKLKKIVEKTPSLNSPSYGKPFSKIFEEAGGDFYKIDPGLFAPAKIAVVHVETGATIQAGELNPKIFLESIGLKEN